MQSDTGIRTLGAFVGTDSLRITRIGSAFGMFILFVFGSVASAISGGMFIARQDALGASGTFRVIARIS